MAKATGGDVVLQLLQEFRQSQQENEVFKRDILVFKQEMLVFKQRTEDRLDLLQASLDASTKQTHGYLKRIAKMLGKLADDRLEHERRLDDHERRLTLLEK